MKINKPFVALVCVLSAAAAMAQDPIKFNVPEQAAGQTPTPAAAAAGFTDSQMIEEVGWLMAKRSGLTDLQFNQVDMDNLIKGFQTALAGKEAPYDLQKIGPQLDSFMQAKQASYLAKLKQQNASQSADFFTKLKDNKNVVQLPSGLCYEIVKPGTGDYPKATDTVKVNYTGTLVDGTVFDSSVQRGQPVEFPLSGVIAGWTEGIQKINKGGTIKLYIPADLAYKDEGRPGIPPGATLIFSVDLLDITAPAPAGPVPVGPAPAPKS